MFKRVFDMVASAGGLLILSPLLVVAAVLVKATSKGPVIFSQERMGREFRPFRIYKFRTMVPDAPRQGGEITFGGDPRITAVGWFLRMTKIDELPQLWNVLKGEMSIVGPRPEVRQYVEEFRADYERLLSVRPGVTGIASVTYVNEANVLAQAKNPEQEYRTVVLPEKIRLDLSYVDDVSIWLDIKVILSTLVRIVKH